MHYPDAGTAHARRNKGRMILPLPHRTSQCSVAKQIPINSSRRSTPYLTSARISSVRPKWVRHHIRTRGHRLGPARHPLLFPARRGHQRQARRRAQVGLPHRAQVVPRRQQHRRRPGRGRPPGWTLMSAQHRALPDVSPQRGRRAVEVPVFVQAAGERMTGELPDSFTGVQHERPKPGVGMRRRRRRAERVNLHGHHFGETIC